MRRCDGGVVCGRSSCDGGDSDGGSAVIISRPSSLDAASASPRAGDDGSAGDGVAGRYTRWRVVLRPFGRRYLRQPCGGDVPRHFRLRHRNRVHWPLQHGNQPDVVPWGGPGFPRATTSSKLHRNAGANHQLDGRWHVPPGCRGCVPEPAQEPGDLQLQGHRHSTGLHLCDLSGGSLRRQGNAAVDGASEHLLACTPIELLHDGVDRAAARESDPLQGFDPTATTSPRGWVHRNAGGYLTDGPKPKNCADRNRETVCI